MGREGMEEERLCKQNNIIQCITKEDSLLALRCSMV